MPNWNEGYACNTARLLSQYIVVDSFASLLTDKLSKPHLYLGIAEISRHRHKIK